MAVHEREIFLDAIKLPAGGADNLVIAVKGLIAGDELGDAVLFVEHPDLRVNFAAVEFSYDGG